MFVHHHNIANLTVSGLGHKQPCSGTVRGMLCVKCHYAIVRQADITAFIQPDGASADGGFLQQSSRTWRIPGGHESEQRCGDGASAAASAGPPATSITHIGKHMTTAKGDGRPILGWTEVCSSFFFFLPFGCGCSGWFTTKSVTDQSQQKPRRTDNRYEHTEEEATGLAFNGYTQLLLLSVSLRRRPFSSLTKSIKNTFV